MASEQNINFTNLIKKKYSGNKSWEVVNRYGERAGTQIFFSMVETQEILFEIDGEDIKNVYYSQFKCKIVEGVNNKSPTNFGSQLESDTSELQLYISKWEINRYK